MRYLNEFPDIWPSVIGLDIETEASSKPDPYTDKIATIQAAFPNGEIYIWTKGFENLADVFDDKSILKICHQAKFEYKFLKHNFGVHLWPVWDSMLMERVLTSGLEQKTDLASTIWRRAEKLIEKDKDTQKSFVKGRKLTNRQLRYVEDDVKYLVSIYEAQQQLLKKEGLEKIENLEHSLIPVVANMELIGIKVDVDKWNEVVSKYRQLCSERSKIVFDAFKLPSHTMSLFGNHPPINLNSTDQSLRLFRQNGMDIEDTEDGTMRDCMEKYPQFSEAIEAFLEYRSYQKLIGFDYPKHINPISGRVHTKYNQLGARSGRFSSSKPNLQNVPRESSIRNVFVPAEGYVIICADYGQQEIRVIAEMSGDKNLMAICLEDDPHLANARKLLNDPGLNELIGETRVVIKNTGFAFCYGAGIEVFANTSGLTVQEAEPIFYALKRLYPGVFKWGNDQRNFLKKNGYVETVWGRKRWFPEGKHYFNEPVNSPIQGTSADMMKRAMVRVDDALNGYDARILLQVHDELVVECKEEQAQEVAKIVECEMEAAAAEMIKSVPCPAEAKIMKCWGK